MMVRLSESTDACIADATPRTVVIEVSKERLNDLQSVTIMDGKVSTSVPINKS